MSRSSERITYNGETTRTVLLQDVHARIVAGRRFIAGREIYGDGRRRLHIIEEAAIIRRVPTT